MRTTEFEKVARIFLLGLGPGETAKSCSRLVCLKLKSQFQRFFKASPSADQLDPEDLRPTDADLVRLCTPHLERYWQEAHQMVEAVESSDVGRAVNPIGSWFSAPLASGQTVTSSNENAAAMKTEKALASWYKYLQAAPMDEALAVLYSSFLKVPDEVIADSLNTTLGTIRYRLGRAHRQMGALLSELQDEKGAP